MFCQSNSRDIHAPVHPRVNMASIQRPSATSASLHSVLPSDEDFVKREKHARTVRRYRRTRQILLAKLEPAQIELYLREAIPCHPAMEFASMEDLDLKELTQLVIDTKAPYRYNESTEQKRWDEILQEVALRAMTDKEHDHLLQGRIPKVVPNNSEQQRWDEILEEMVIRRMTVMEQEAIIQHPPRSKNPVKQRRWDRIIYEQWLRSLTVKEHDRFVQGLLKVPAHLIRPNVSSSEPEFTTIYAQEA